MEAVREYGHGNTASTVRAEKTKSVLSSPPSDEPNNQGEPYQARISAEEGETLQLAEEMSSSLGEPYGSIAYFEITSQLACQCDPNRNSLEGVSWARVKQGYTDLQRLYGTNKVKMNRFAFMSFLERDKSSARGTFALLGDTWDPDVWRTEDKFYSAKQWADTP
jgi:hypothetical protein